ncbi:MAG TPA: hypothetical protein DER41_00710 [Firmicutes bacterium]|jgi:membrane associated rhomboid family serine protease|nr:hypothetical protein [Bacillota bacterium]
MERSLAHRVRTFLFTGFNPAVKLILIIHLVFFLITAIWRTGFGLAFQPHYLFQRPWTLLTYPMLNTGFISMLLSGLWWWFMGSAMERFWGSKRFIVAWIVLVAASALGIWLGFLISGSYQIVLGWYLPLAALTVAWSVTHQGQAVMLYGLIPVKSQWLAWISIAGVFFGYVGTNFFLALCALIGCGVGYLFGVIWPGRTGVHFPRWRRKIREIRLKRVK